MFNHLTDGFLSSGKAGLSSIVLALRNFVQIAHDHSEPLATKIAAAAIPSATLLERHIEDSEIRSRAMSPYKLDDSDAGGLSVAAATNETEDTNLTNTITVSSSVATKVLALYTARIPASAGASEVDIVFRLNGVDSPRSYAWVETSGFFTTVSFDFSHWDILSLPVGSNTIKIIWKTKGTTTAFTAPGTRRLHLQGWKS